MLEAVIGGGRRAGWYNVSRQSRPLLLLQKVASVLHMHDLSTPTQSLY